MKEVLLEVGLGALTAAVAALVLVPTFVVLKLLLDAGLEVMFPSVIIFGLLLAYILRRETVGR
jgi:hypothetical protein